MTTTKLGALFRLLGFSMRVPTVELTTLISNSGLRDDIRDIWLSLELPEDEVQAFYEDLEIYIGRDAEDLMHELRRETTRLHLGDKPLISNTEGMWRKKAEGKINPVFMINTYSTEVSDFMRKCGVVKAEGYNDSIDFIWTEFDFAASLADGPAYLAEKGLDASALLDEFIDDHLKLWIPGFCSDVINETKTVYYRSLCTLIRTFIELL